MGNLDGIRYYSDYTLEDQFQYNIIDFISYGLLEVGAFINIRKGQRDSFNNDQSLLRPVSIQNYPSNKIYGGLKNNWVWESGVSVNGTTPISISGIYVNNTFIPNGTTVAGTGWYIDYQRGWVVFNNQLTGNPSVQIEHTLRHVNVLPADSQFYKHIITEYQNRENWNINGSGIDNINFESKAFLPAIFVDVRKYSSNPLEIGSRSKWALANVNFEIFATNPGDRKRLSDICYMMEHKSFNVYNLNTAPRPLTVSGTISQSAQTWPNLVNNYPLGRARFEMDAVMSKNNSVIFPIQYASVRIGCKMPVSI